MTRPKTLKAAPSHQHVQRVQGHCWWDPWWDPWVSIGFPHLPCWSLPGRAHPVDRLRSFQGSLLGGISIHLKGVGNEDMIGRNWGRNCGIEVDCTTAQNKMWQMCRERSGGLCFQSTHRMLGQGIYKIWTLVRHVFLEIPRSSSFAIELSPQSIYLSKMDTLPLPSCPTGW